MSLIESLTALGIESCAEVLDANDIDETALQMITDDDLKDLGIKSMGTRKKLLKLGADLAAASGSASSSKTKTAKPVADKQPKKPTAQPKAPKADQTTLGRSDRESTTALRFTPPVVVTPADSVAASDADSELRAQYPAQELKSEIRAGITAWANTIDGHDLTDLGDQVEISDIQALPAYAITHKQLFESRDVVSKIKPHTGDEYAPCTLKREECNPWPLDAPSAPGDFIKQSHTFTLDGSHRTGVCVECQGRRMEGCGTCNSRGEVRCGSCTGCGEVDCYSCSGKGAVDCGSCGGKGYRTCDVLSHAMGTDGGKRSCSKCHGSPKSFTGKIPCYSCSNGKNQCDRCAGRGRNRCDSCGGGGKLTCSTCSGAGEVNCNLCDAAGSVVIYLDMEVGYAPQVTRRLVIDESIHPELVTERLPGHWVDNNDNSGTESGRAVPEPVLSYRGTPIDWDRITAQVKPLGLEGWLSERQAFIHEDGARLVDEAVDLERVPLYLVTCTHRDRPYRFFAVSNASQIWTRESPIHDHADALLKEARALALASAKVKNALDRELLVTDFWAYEPGLPENVVPAKSLNDAHVQYSSYLAMFPEDLSVQLERDYTANMQSLAWAIGKTKGLLIASVSSFIVSFALHKAVVQNGNGVHDPQEILMIIWLMLCLLSFVASIFVGFEGLKFSKNYELLRAKIIAAEEKAAPPQ